MAMKIDPYKTWQTLEERLKTEKNPLHRVHLERLITHFKGEAAGDIDKILTTLCDDPTYISYDNPDGAPRVFKGKEGVRQFYHEMLSAISVNLEFFVDNLVVDDYCIITEGNSKSAMRGSVLKAMGVPVDDPDAYYLGEGRTLVVWPFDKNDLILGEHIYRAFSKPLDNINQRKLRPEDIGQYEAA